MWRDFVRNTMCINDLMVWFDALVYFHPQTQLQFTTKVLKSDSKINISFCLSSLSLNLLIVHISAAWFPKTQQLFYRSSNIWCAHSSSQRKERDGLGGNAKQKSSLMDFH